MISVFTLVLHIVIEVCAGMYLVGSSQHKIQLGYHNITRCFSITDQLENLRFVEAGM